MRLRRFVTSLLGAVVLFTGTIFAGQACWATSGDFNNDGRADLVLAGGTGWSTVPVGFSNADGSFRVSNLGNTQISSWATTPGVHVVSGDFNGDGNYDLALVGGNGWASIPVGFSNGNGTFRVTNITNTQFANWATVPGVQVLTGDFNNDKKSDIALVGGRGWSTIPVAFSNGDGSFRITNLGNANIPVWATAPGVKAITGDYNQDGKCDLALIGGYGWSTVPVAFSNGDGTFWVTNELTYYIPTWSRAAGVRVVSGDFNGDSKSDFALVGGASWGSIPVAFSNGNGTFIVTNIANSNIPVWATTSGVQVVSGDYNNDGKSDIGLVGGEGWSTVPVGFSNGDGSFRVTNIVNNDLPNWATVPGVQVISADDSLGIKRCDLALSGGTGWATVPVGFSDGKGGFGVTNLANNQIASWATTPGVQLVRGDFNKDGRVDIALVGGSGWMSVPVGFSNGDGTFRVTNIANSYIPNWATHTGVRVVSGDFNGDGKCDLALVGGNGWGSIPVAFSNGDGSFNVTNIANANISSWATAAGVRVVSGDFNNDGKCDLALVGGNGWGSVPVAFSNGDGSFRVTNVGNANIPIWATVAGVKVISGDFDGDGRCDIALVGGNGWSTIPVAFSKGDGSFTVSNVTNANISTWATVDGVKALSGDFNYDGKADIALIGGNGWGSVPVAFSNGDGSFGVTNIANSQLATWSRASGVQVVAGDFNQK